MYSFDKEDWFIMIVGSFAFFLSSFIIGTTLGSQNIKKQAVKQGYAEWVSDENGHVTFVWKNKKWDK